MLGEIGVGGMATVHLARTRGVAGFERLVAIKRCHPHVRAAPSSRDMFLDEARLAAMIRHPNVVSTIDVVDDGESLSIVMDYVEGVTVSELSRAASEKGERLPIGATLRIVVDALAGLHYAHELTDADGRSLELVHRDVSPQNMLVGLDGVTRLADFGIARAATRSTITREGELKGKLRYMAPEQFRKQAATRQSDVYAAGVVLWETLTGRRLFDAESEGELIDQVLRVFPAPASTHARDVSPALDAAVKRALARDPSERFATAAELAAAIGNAGHALDSARGIGEHVARLCGEAIRARRTPLAHPVAQAESTADVTLADPVESPAPSAASSPAAASSPGRRRALGVALALTMPVALYLAAHARTKPSAEASPPAESHASAAHEAAEAPPLTRAVVDTGAEAAAIPTAVAPSRTPTKPSMTPRGRPATTPRARSSQPANPKPMPSFHPTEL
jgi:serine/threonine-protein kinase